ncbi:MAG: enoyl-CoA hydratase-related protein, partial [Octadecabacter sp.]
MTGIVRIEREGDIGLICLTKPPVNALGVALRTAVGAALDTLLSDAGVKAIVLYGEGRFFSAGADIKDFARAAEKPTLPDVLKALNNSPKPVIAALHGVAFGGALELALATHLRVGITGVKLGLPEVKLGLLPGAGGTQRLTRLTGIAAATDIICKGRDVLDGEALELGIIARLENGDARDVGIQAAQDVLNGTLTATPTDSLTVAPDAAALTAARAKYANGLNAPLRAIDAIEAATLPITEGLQQERALFMALMDSPQRAGLVHAFFAERATAKIPEQHAQKRPIAQVGVVGGGTMGVGIATAFLNAGFPVTLIETKPDAAERAKAAIETNLASALKRGKLTTAGHAAALSALTCSTQMGVLSDVDLVVEAIFEDMSAKTSVFAALDKVCKQGC